MKICDFCLPNPGSAISRRSRSRASLASLQIFSASPSYSVTTQAASCCSRAAMEPGKRWIAGVIAAKSANLAGSAAAIAPGSSEPKRSFTFAGPRNACSIGYC